MKKDINEPLLKEKKSDLSIEERVKKSKNLKIALVSIAEMGHVLPILHIGEALVQRGHEVYFITNSFGKTKNVQKIAEADGIKVIFTDDNLA